MSKLLWNALIAGGLYYGYKKLTGLKHLSDKLEIQYTPSIGFDGIYIKDIKLVNPSSGTIKIAKPRVQIYLSEQHKSDNDPFLDSGYVPPTEPIQITPRATTQVPDIYFPLSVNQLAQLSKLPIKEGKVQIIQKVSTPIMVAGGWKTMEDVSVFSLQIPSNFSEMGGKIKSELEKIVGFTQKQTV